MSALLADSEIFGHLWTTPEVRSMFDDRGRTQSWLEILAALASCQAELELIPADAAAAITAGACVDRLDFRIVAEETRRSGHSTLGLIRAWRETLPESAREWVYYGATVQDITDTWTGLVMREMLRILLRALREIEQALLDLSVQHRDTLCLGRTHAQPGLPITFGFKTAVWAAETRRHIERVISSRERLVVGQLAGAVGTCSFWGPASLELQRLLCDRVGLNPPEMTWLTARDRIAEFVTLLALVTGTLAKIGNEVMNLQRSEIGEVSEQRAEGVVGSITMPHKQNPELSEHLGTLARVVRSTVPLALEGLVHEHERDGAAWKTEWWFLPESCLAASAALKFGLELVRTLEVHPVRMLENLSAQKGYVLSEPVMRRLAARLGKHTAHELVHRVAISGQDSGQDFFQALVNEPDVTAEVSEDELRALLEPAEGLGANKELVDALVARSRLAREQDPAW